MTVQWLVALDQTFKIERQWEDANGFLHVWGRAALEGTMDYPEHGFKAFVPGATLKASAEELVGKPVTREHPPKGKLIAPEDAKDKVLGTVLDASYDEADKSVLFHAVVYDATLKSEIKTKRRYQVSPGYLTHFADLKQPTGDGATKYQAKRVYNHLAFVEAARGGDNCVAFDAAPPATTTEKPIMDQDPKNENPKPSFDADKFKSEIMDELKAFMSERGKSEKKDEPKDEPKPSMDSKELFSRVKRAQGIVAKHGLEVADSDDILAYEAAVAKAFSGKDVDAALIPGVLFAADAAPARTDAERTREQFRADKKDPKTQGTVTADSLKDLPPARAYSVADMYRK